MCWVRGEAKMRRKEEGWIPLSPCTISSTAFKTPLASFSMHHFGLLLPWDEKTDLISADSAGLFSCHNQMLSHYEVSASSGVKTATLDKQTARKG